ncbi:unnamed protein product [Peronospora belbahrii]|uniref:tRNA (guanine-N(7)-)-methyltransferase non-catalytic subunit TRM82 n=1 Tax=Peronospora belbahrii TaxID=622444 RepID=A0AAU9L530_9STRA|nr:unnamed protein product [Peronospora belbahrii]
MVIITGVFVASAQGVVVTVRNTTVFVLPTNASETQKLLQFELRQDAGDIAEAPEIAENKATKLKQATQPVPPSNRITAILLFQPQYCEHLALLLLVDERRLVHYELNLSAETLLLKTLRSVPRSATCMTVGTLKITNGEMKHVVILGQKTGEVVAVPFPDVARDLKMLLGHTTSMITHVALNHDSSLLLTADRDEKLRVSRFPNAAIIESYCLGHAASLTKVACSSVTPELVVSTSIDNTLKLWDMTTGKLLATKTLLVGLDVSIEHADKDEANDEDSDRKAAKSLLNVSLSICSKTNIVAVLVNYQYVRFFEIECDKGIPTMREMAIPIEDEQLLLANEPCEILFTEDEMLAVSYKKNPFLQLYSISKGENKRLSPVDFNSNVLNDFRSAAAAIELVDDEESALDTLEDGLKKKKARTGEGNKMVPGDK